MIENTKIYECYKKCLLQESELNFDEIIKDAKQFNIKLTDEQKRLFEDEFFETRQFTALERKYDSAIVDIAVETIMSANIESLAKLRKVFYDIVEKNTRRTGTEESFAIEALSEVLKLMKQFIK